MNAVQISELEIDALWKALVPDPLGLVAAIVQSASDGSVLMVGYMNRDALGATFQTGRVTFWSRSRQELWEKGATSGNTLKLVSVRVDCDGDALLVIAHPVGPTCHTGAPSCFFRAVDDEGRLQSVEAPMPELGWLVRVGEVIASRKRGEGATAADGRSYVRGLLDGGAPKIGSKLREEADELAVAIAHESDERVASEAADLLFHALVGLASRDLSLEDVTRVLSERFGTSGIDEKRARATSPKMAPPTEEPSA